MAETVLHWLAAWLAGATGLSQTATLGLVWFVGAAILPGILLGVGGLMTYLMRKTMARVQQRVGPNRVGPVGLLQFVADGIKLTSKEDIIPAKVERTGFLVAPFIFVLPVILAFAPIPWGPGVILSDVRVGILLILALSFVSPLGEIIAGWASNNKYSMVGGLRAAAVDVSYEIPLVLATVAIVMLTGSLNTQDIVAAQQGLWFVALQPLGVFIFFAGALAKAGVVPVDLAEAESELVGGFATEYSGMRFGVFFVGIFVGIVLVSTLTVLLFFGGWSMPFIGATIPLIGATVPAWTGPLWFVLKVFVFSIFVIIVWFTLPRIRVDQYLNWGWKVLFPLSVLNLVIAAAEVYYLGGI
jgi:NADH:ubiquinone oxidoreductase subunit H